MLNALIRWPGALPLREGRLLAASELDRVLLAAAAPCRLLWKQPCRPSCEAFPGLGEWLPSPPGCSAPLSWKRALPLRQAGAGRPKRAGTPQGTTQEPQGGRGHHGNQLATAAHLVWLLSGPHAQLRNPGVLRWGRAEALRRIRLGRWREVFAEARPLWPGAAGCRVTAALPHR